MALLSETLSIGKGLSQPAHRETVGEAGGRVEEEKERPGCRELSRDPQEKRCWIWKPATFCCKECNVTP